MRIVVVNELPRGKRTLKHDLLGMINEFADSEAITAKVEITDRDYANVRSCYTNMHRAAKSSGRQVSVRMIDGNVYLVKRRGMR